MQTQHNCLQHSQLELTEAVLFFLMSRFGVRPCSWIAQAIVHHLEQRLEIYALQSTPLKAKYCFQLLPTWRVLAGQLCELPTHLSARVIPITATFSNDIHH